MSTENHLNKPYAEVLTDLRAKRDEIDKTIKFLESMSGIKLSTGTATAASEAVSMSEPSEPDSSLGAGAFLGMSIVDATKKLLSIRKRQMGNPEIARELAEGGLVMNSADPVNTVGSVLTRRFNQVGDIVKVARGTWGLKEWYPNRSFKTSSKSPSTIDAPRSGVSDSGGVEELSSSSEEVSHDLIG